MVYDLVITCMLFLTLFLCALIIHNPLVRCSAVIRSQVFTRLRVLKELSTVEVLDSKVKAINNTCRAAGSILQYQIIIL